METKTLTVRLTLTEEMLGTASANPEIHSEYIASKAPDAMSMEEEVAAIGADEVEKKAMTVFPPGRGRCADLMGLPDQGVFQGRLQGAPQGAGQREQQDQGVQAGDRRADLCGAADDQTGHARRENGRMPAAIACIHAVGRAHRTGEQ